MADYVLSCCSTADYPRAFFEDRQILLTEFHYQMDGEARLDDLYATQTPHEFFSRIAAGSQPTTSQPAAGEFVDTWEPVLASGRDILHVTLSSGISGAYNSACIARDQLAGRYPERRVVVVDSLNASSGYGLLMEYLADLRERGAGLDEAAAWAEDNKLRLNAWFYVSDLECLKRGGRVSKTSALIATALKICPLLNIDAEGKLIPREKIRTKRKALAACVRASVGRMDGGAAYAGKCAVVHSDCRADAEEAVRLLEAEVPALAGKIEVNDIGTVIGSHTGPGTVGIFFMGERRAG